MNAHRTLLRASLCLALLTIAACGDSPATPDAFSTGGTDAFSTGGTDAFSTGGTDAFSAGDPDAFTPSGTVLFSRDVLPILEANCRGSGCHGTPQTFFLGGGRGCMGMPFVVAGDPDASFVVDKLEGTMASGCGMRMPRGRTPLSSTDVATIRTWISEGALNN